MGTGDKAAGRDGAGAAADGAAQAIARWYRDVGQFHLKFGFPRATFRTDPDTIRWRAHMVTEEADELVAAVDMESQIREAMDVAYIALGCMWTYDREPKIGPVPYDLGDDDRVLIVTVSRQLCRAMVQDDGFGVELCAMLIIHTVETYLRRLRPTLGIATFWNELHRANMDKICVVEGQRPAKPKGWLPPDIAGTLAG